MKRIISFFILIASCLPVLAQTGTPIKQSGNVTPTHAWCVTTNGIAQDCGTAAVPFLTSIGTVGQGQTICAWSALSTAPGSQKICLGVTDAGGASLVVQNFGTDPAMPFSIVLNGVTYQFPYTVGGIVGPSTTIVGDLAVWNNTTGTLLKDVSITQLFNTQIDIYLVIGDSNAVGQGSSASSPLVQPGMALTYCANATIVAANDPTCSAVNAAQNANTGSMWPATSNAYGRRIGFVLAGVFGSTQSSAADFGIGNGNWQSTSPGGNYANSLTALNAALTAYTAAGYTPTFRGIIYVLGSNDALQIDNSVITVGQYTSALTAMTANYRAATIGGVTYPRLQFWMPIIGTNITGGVSDAGYSQVRAAQLTFAAADGNFSVPFTDMFSFASRGLMNSGAHPTQAGYNIMGTAIGSALIPATPANIPYQLFSANAGIGGTAPSGTVLQTIGADGTPNSSLIDAYGTVAAVPQVQFRRAEGTLVAPSAVQSGDIMGILGVQSYGATTFGTTNQGALLFSASQNHTDSAKGTQAALYTTANGAATATARMTVQAGGNIGFGTETNPQSAFVFSQNVTTALVPTTFNGPVFYGVDGVAAAGYNAVVYGGIPNNIFARIDGTAASPSNLGNGEITGGIIFSGWGNGTFQAGRARMLANTTEAWSGTTFGVDLEFDTTAAGGSRAQAMLLKGGLIVGPGTTDPGAGNLLVGGGNLTSAGSAPTCAATGIGSTGTCTLATGSNDLAGEIKLTVGGSGISDTGVITLTLNASLGADEASCILMAANGTGTWTAPVTFIQSVLSQTVPAFTWFNATTNLTTSDIYNVKYHCIGY